MAKVELKAQAIALKWAEQAGAMDLGSLQLEALRLAIEVGLREQDRDTRHACAEAVLNAANPHEACINANAV